MLRNQGPAKKRSKLVLQKLQISDQELEQVVKFGHEMSQPEKLLLRVDGNLQIHYWPIILCPLQGAIKHPVLQHSRLLESFRRLRI
jgi:hypothetical protein